jgi:hypothetical protein
MDGAALVKDVYNFSEVSGPDMYRYLTRRHVASAWWYFYLNGQAHFYLVLSALQCLRISHLIKQAASTISNNTE